MYHSLLFFSIQLYTSMVYTYQNKKQYITTNALFSKIMLRDNLPRGGRAGRTRGRHTNNNATAQPGPVRSTRPRYLPRAGELTEGAHTEAIADFTSCEGTFCKSLKSPTTLFRIPVPHPLSIVSKQGLFQPMATAKTYFRWDRQDIKDFIDNPAAFLNTATPPAKLEIRNNRRLLLTGVKNWDRDILKGANPVFFAEKPFMMAAVGFDNRALVYADASLLDDPDVVYAAVWSQNTSPLGLASPRLRDDPNFMLHVMAKAHSSFEHASARLRDDIEVVLKAITIFPGALRYASPRLQDHREVVLHAIAEAPSGPNRNDRHCPYRVIILKYASPRLQDDRDIVMRAITKNPFDLMRASTNLKNDKRVVHHALSHPDLGSCGQSGRCIFRHAGSSVRNDLEIVTLAVRRWPLALRFAGQVARGTFGIVMTAVSQMGQALRFASDSMRDNKQVVMTAVARSPTMIGLASRKLRDDRDVVLAAITSPYEDDYESAMSLRLASDNLRDDPSIVQEAIRRHPWAFEYAGPNCQDDIAIAAPVVNANPLLLEFTGPNVRDDRALVLNAVTKEPDVIVFASERLRRMFRVHMGVVSFVRLPQSDR